MAKKEKNQDNVDREVFRVNAGEGIWRDTAVDGGEVIYRELSGQKIDVDYEDARFHVSVILDQLKDLAEIFVNENQDRIGYLLLTLLRDAQKKCQKMFDVIDRDIGSIECAYLEDRSPPFEAGSFFGATLEQSETFKKKLRKTDPEPDKGGA